MTVFRPPGLAEPAQCIGYNFELCFWRNATYGQVGPRMFSANNEYVHRWVGADLERFSALIEQLHSADSAMRDRGFNLLHATS